VNANGISGLATGKCVGGDNNGTFFMLSVGIMPLTRVKTYPASAGFLFVSFCSMSASSPKALAYGLVTKRRLGPCM
jgi:hypothetical protein